jgi:hypothetical protein
MQDLERVKHTIRQLIPVAMLYDDAGKCVFYCFKVFFENPNFGGSYLEIGKKANAGFCFSLSCIIYSNGQYVL